MSYPSYRVSYPLYLDVSDPHKQSGVHLDPNFKLNGFHKELNPSPSTALINLNAFYETMLATGHTNASRTGQMPVLGFNNAQCTPHRLSQDYSAKSSFSIEAILGIANRQNSYLSINESKGCDFDANYRPDYNLCSQFNSKCSDHPKAKTIASVSPDSTAKEHMLRYNKKPSNKVSGGNGYRSHTREANKRSIDSVDSSQSTDQNTISQSITSKSAKLDINQRLMCQNKAKRVRTIFTPDQLEKLEAEFERQQYMVGPERLYLASALNLSEAQVKVWFQNRRIKWRKQHLELEQASLKKDRHADMADNKEDANNEATSDESHSVCRSPSHSLNAFNQ